jgi:hypothetical protein
MLLKPSKAPNRRLLRAALCASGAIVLVAAVDAQTRQNAAGMNLRSLVLRFQSAAAGGGGGSTGGNGGVISGSNPRSLSRVTVINPGVAPPP